MSGTETATAEPTDQPAPPPRVSTALLFRERAELEIEHNGEIYRLRITRAGKLILTK